MDELLRRANGFGPPDLDDVIRKAERRLRVLDDVAGKAERNLLLTDRLDRLHSIAHLAEPDLMTVRLREAQSRLAAIAGEYRNPFDQLDRAIGLSAYRRAQEALEDILPGGTLRRLEDQIEAVSRPWKRNTELQDSLTAIAGKALQFEQKLEESRKIAAGIVGRNEFDEALKRVASFDPLEGLGLSRLDVQRLLEEVEVSEDGAIVVDDGVIEREIIQYWARLLAAAANGMDDCHLRLRLLWIEIGERFGPIGQIVLTFLFSRMIHLLIVSVLCEFDEELLVDIPDWVADCGCDLPAQTENAIPSFTEETPPAE